MESIIAVAGVTGDLGGRIARALVARGAQVRGLLPRTVPVAETERLAQLGISIVQADPNDASAMAEACAGAASVVSALNGLRPVIIERQGVLLDAAVRARVPRFIPSDYAADFTKTTPRENRNFDLRREFMVRADQADIQVTSVLNGAFMELLGAQMPIIRRRLRRVLYWGDGPDQALDFTTKDDVAAYVAAVALDPHTPRFLRIAGDVVSARAIANAMSEVTGKRFRTLGVGSIEALGTLIRLARALAPAPADVFSPWQGMQYLRDMYSGKGKLQPLDNDRYPELTWTKVPTLLRAAADR